MKIFILEDSVERIAFFYRLSDIGHNVTICNNVKDGIKILQNIKFDYLLLDHDLGGLAYVDSRDDNTGYALCQCIYNTMNCLSNIIIHSWNEVGANNMKYILETNSHKGEVSVLMYMTDEFNERMERTFNLT